MISIGDRTKSFALDIIQICKLLTNSFEGKIIGKQLLRCGTSVGAQYREARRARSKAEFISKLESAIQVMDETIYWLEIITESEMIPNENLNKYINEANEVISILISSAKKVKQQSSTTLHDTRKRSYG